MLNYSNSLMTTSELHDNNSRNILVTNNISHLEYHDRTYNWPVLFFFLIVIAAIGGNILVCLAVKYERKLQNMFNFFLVSLALSDMLSATLVMPLSIIKAFVEDLPVPKIMCVLWYSLDVLFTSSTIIHLCMISVDRFMSLKYPLRYGHAKKPKHTIMKIVSVWIISICIAGPLFLLSMFDNDSNVHYKGCGPETPIFVISATVTSFYLPLLIMTIMYALTVRALRQQLKEQRRLAVTNSLSSRDDSSCYRRPSPRSSPRASPKTSPRSSPRPSNGNMLSASQIATQPGSRRNSLTNKDTTEVSSIKTSAPEHSDAYLLVKDPRYLDAPAFITPSSTCTDIAAEVSRDYSPTQPTHKKRLKVRIFRFHRNEGTSESSRRVLNGLDRGRKAVQVLGILFAVFVIFYLPFFASYVIRGTCKECAPYISPQMIVAFEWLAYSGSMFNPIIYHIFNPDFRRAFQKLLRCKCIHAHQHVHVRN